MPAVISEHLDVNASPWNHVVLTIPGWNTTTELCIQGSNNTQRWLAEAEERDHQNALYFEKMLIKYSGDIDEDTRTYIKNGIKSLIPANV